MATLKTARALARGAVALTLLLASVGIRTQELNADLREQVEMIPKKGLFTTTLETTIFRPPGDGPFPLVFINHGKAVGNPRFQARYRPLGPARFYLQRGYAVIVPMRQGFSKSEGSYIGGGCNVESNGIAQAEDVKVVLDYLVALSWVDKDRILITGQSHGGWTSLAFGTLGYPGVRGLINFAGGVRQESCAGWEATLGRAGGSYARQTKVPSLWFYGDNDSYFSSYTFHNLHETYVAAGGKAELLAFGRFGSDSHAMFGSRSGESIWQPKAQAFMRELNLPTEVLYPELAPAKSLPVPPPSGFALLAEDDKAPFVKEKGREGYKTFLTKQFPRAFAISNSGSWGWAEMGDDPLQRALATCNKFTKDKPCHLYAVDDQVVWVKA